MSEWSASDDAHAVRLYTVRRDGGGGVELLRQRDIVDYVREAERDVDSVVLTELVADCADVTCITMLRRLVRGPSETWLCPYTNDSVVPPGLRVSTSSMATADEVDRSRYREPVLDQTISGSQYLY